MRSPLVAGQASQDRGRARSPGGINGAVIGDDLRVGVGRFGGIPLRQNRRAVIRDPAPAPAPYPRKQLIKRLRKRECELCETGTTVAVHQVTRLKELGKPGPGQPAWAALMAKMRRKTPIVCAAWHE